jgi:hypothetical protein
MGVYAAYAINQRVERQDEPERKRASRAEIANGAKADDDD